MSDVKQQLVAVDTSYDNVVVSSAHHLTIQNLGTVPVYMKLGGAATTSTGGFSYVIPAGGAANDGTGGILNVSGFVGTISFITASGSANVVVSNG